MSALPLTRFLPPWIHPKSLFRPALWLLPLLLILATGRAQAQHLDLNGSGMSYIWELIYNGTNLNPNVDNDGDGVINLLESIAGTNPFDSNSYPQIPSRSWSWEGTNFTVTLPAALGKLYILQSSYVIPHDVPINWSNEFSTVPRSGTTVSLSATVDQTQPKYFRLSISDIDPLNHGLNDWEEYQLGLDPTKISSNGQLDSNGVPMTDLAYVLGKLASQNVVTITASSPAAIQPDPGQAVTQPGAFTLTRGGFPLNSITITLGLGGPGAGFAVEGVDHAALPRSVTFPVGVSSESVTLTPLADTNLLADVIAMYKLQPGSSYTVGTASNASVVISPSPTGMGAGLTGYYYTNSSTNYTNSANFNPTNFLTNRLDAAINFTWGTTNSPPITNSGDYSVRWTGQIQPQYSEQYYFDVYCADGVKLWVNDQLIINDWQSQNAADMIGTIVLQAGARYDLKLEYFVHGKVGQTQLYWYSPDQSRELIPSSVLYPSTYAPAPTTIISPLTAVAFVGQPFSFSVVGANTATYYTAAGLPPGLSFNPTNGLISGTNNLAGNFEIALTASNSVGVAASMLSLQVFENSSAVTREVWLNVPGTNISDIPLATASTLTNTLSSLEGITGYGTNYGERVTGYFTAPATGNYLFWIAGSDSAQLWIADDNQPVDNVLRATAAATAPRQWTIQPGQRSPWLALNAGQNYFLEVLHKAGTNASDNWSVAWMIDPTGTNTVPPATNTIVPGYLLSRYFQLPPSLTAGTMYTANLLAAPGVNSTAQGSATLNLNAAGTQAILTLSLNNLSSAITGQAIDNDPYLTYPSQLLFDIAGVKPPPQNGTYTWNIKAIGAITNATIIDQIIQQGDAYIIIQTAKFLNGEISGHFIPLNGSQTFTPPAAPPAWTDDHTDPNAAARFLTQATFGATEADIAAVQAMGYAAWISNQFQIPASHHLPLVLGNVNPNPQFPYPSTLTINTWWQQSITAPDQLRQRVAFALSEIMVISQNGVLQNLATALSSYYDTLLDNSLGNYRSLLQGVTLHPAMGNYLDMRGNSAGSIITGLHADENYAREVQQLFSIGLYRLWPDGTLVLNSSNNPVPTYNQNGIMGFASVFTGWNYYQPNQTNGRLPTSFSPPANYTNPMVLVPSHHELGTKLLLDNVVLPAAQGSQTNAANTNYDLYGQQDLQAALDSIFNHPNVGPFICRELIQRLVTSSPSPDYVYRVAQVFNDNGQGVRGDMQAVITAILLDYEARSPSLISVPTYGKQREPLIRATAAARAFPPPADTSGTYSETGLRTITVSNTSPHNLNNGDTVQLTFTDASGNPAPAPQAYGVTVTGSNTFTINAAGISAATYGQVSNVITVTNSGHGLLAGNSVYLDFTSGGASNGAYVVAGSVSNLTFTVTAPDTNPRTGNCLFPKWSGSGYVQKGTNITVSMPGDPGLAAGNGVFIDFTSGSATNGVYQVLSNVNTTNFVVTTTVSANQTRNSLAVYPLVAPPLNRSGTVNVQFSTWNIGFTDTGASSALDQTPLNSPTVFNFFYPGYRYPGILASAGLTTPEFQLTSDTTAAEQMNFLEGGILGTNNNVNGLASFNSGNGAVVLDLGPWVNTNYTSSNGLPTLISSLNTLLAAGEVSTNATAAIQSYVLNTNNLAYGTPPTQAQISARVRAVAHLLLESPDCIIQK